MPQLNQILSLRVDVPDPIYLSIKHIGQMALPTILTVMHRGHEDTGSTLCPLLAHCSTDTNLSSLATYLRRRALPPQALDFPIPIDLVVLQHGQLGLLALVLDLLRRRIHLLLALLGSTSQAQYQMECGFLLDVVI